ncbi:hypothetical protein BH09PSE5_BH09PSE5_22790 [soil metagenome]
MQDGVDLAVRFGALPDSSDLVDGLAVAQPVRWGRRESPGERLAEICYVSNAWAGA